MKKNVLIISNTGDIHTDDLVSACKRLDVNCFRYNTDLFRLDGVVNWDLLNDGVLKIHDHICRLSDFNLLIYRRPTQVHRYRKDIELWVGALIDNEWDVIERAFSFYVSGKVVNSIAASAAAKNKLIQIRVAKEVGLAVPETVISSDIQVLREFLERGICITKGIGSGSILIDRVLRTARTSIIRMGSLDGLDAIGSPTLLQRYVKPKAMWRLVAVGEKVFGFRLQGDILNTEIDSRVVEDQLEGGLSKIPYDIEEKYMKMLSKLSLLYASSDFIEDENGCLWFIDLNPEGQWGAYEERFGVPISNEIISLAKNE